MNDKFASAPSQPTSHAYALATCGALLMLLATACSGAAVPDVTGDAVDAGRRAPTEGARAARADAGSSAAQEGSGAGCDADLENDPKNCGACGIDCRALTNVSGPATCAEGMCLIPPASCASGTMHCSSRTADGCETDRTDPDHCGSCDSKCGPETPYCARSVTGGYACASDCASAGDAVCGKRCVDLKTSALHCGACDNECPPVPHARATCESAACGFTCEAGFAHCHGDAKNGCEVDLQDAANCGTCGHDCLEGVCRRGGSCSEFPIATIEGGVPHDVVVDGTNVYVASDDGVYEASKKGGPMVLIASAKGAASGLAQDDAAVYFGDATGLVQRIDKSSHAVTTEFQDDAAIKSLAVHDGRLSWTTSSMHIGSVWSDGSHPSVFQLGTTIVPGHANGIVADDSGVYFTGRTSARGYVGEVGAGPLVWGHAPLGIATDASSIYWTEEQTGAVYESSKDGSVVRDLTGGSAVSPIVANIVVDESFAYWVDLAGGKVMKVALHKKLGPIVVAKDQAQPWGIAVDGEALYWTNAGSGKVMKLAK